MRQSFEAVHGWSLEKSYQRKCSTCRKQQEGWCLQGGPVPGPPIEPRAALLRACLDCAHMVQAGGGATLFYQAGTLLHSRSLGRSRLDVMRQWHPCMRVPLYASELILKHDMVCMIAVGWRSWASWGQVWTKHATEGSMAQSHRTLQTCMLVSSFLAVGRAPLLPSAVPDVQAAGLWPAVA